MYYNRTIGKIIAGLLFVLFALNITPRQWLHDTVTGHKHVIAAQNDADHLQNSKSGFQCNWDNQLAESPFEDHPAFQLPQPASAFFTYAVHCSQSLHSTDLFFSSLRGPPAKG